MNNKILLVLLLLFFFFPNIVFAQEIKQGTFVPGEVIVRYKDGQLPEVIKKSVDARAQKNKSLTGKFQNLVENVGLQVTGKDLPEEKLQRIQEVKDEFQVTKEEKLFTSSVLGENSFGEMLKTEDKTLNNFVVYKGNENINTQEMLNDFKSLPEVKNVELNYYLYTNQVSPIVPNDTLYPQMWGLSKIEAGKAWSITKGSDNIIVAVIDTGIDKNHEDFAGRLLVNGKDFAMGDNDPQEEVGSGGHGTHVAGTIGAMTNNNLGVSGVNWNVKIMPLKVFDQEGSCNSNDVVNAIKYAADNNAKVINMSLGGRMVCYSDGVIQEAINYAYNKGTTIVVAAGNDDIDVAGDTPAGCDNVIAVASSINNDNRASYSNYGTKVALAAPGGDYDSTGDCNNDNCILSSYFPEGEDNYDRLKYIAIPGTSMASPHVAGVVALMLAANQSLTPNRIKSILSNPVNLDPITTEAGKPIGAGRLNAYKAVLAASGGTTATLTPTRTPTPTATRTPAPTATLTLTPTATKTPTPTATTRPTSSPTATLTSTITPFPTTTSTVTLTPTATMTPAPVCLPTQSAGFKIILKAPKGSTGNCVYSEYHTGQGSLSNACRVIREERSCN